MPLMRDMSYTCVCVHAYAREEQNVTEKEELRKCKVLLTDLLKDKEYQDTRKVIRALEQEGIKHKGIIKKARIELQIKTRNNGDGTWSWRL